MLVYQVDREAVVKTQEERRAERGGFNKRLLLLFGVVVHRGVVA
jgi:hypothetical protein